MQNCRIALAAAVFDRRHSYNAKPTISKTGARSAIAVSPMVSVVGSGAGFDLHVIFFAAAFGVRSIFPAGSQSSLPEVRLHFGRQTLPGTSTLTRPGHVLCPDKKHPAAARAPEARLARSWLPWPRRSRPTSRSLPSDTAVWLSYAVSGGAVLSWWFYDQLLLVGTLVLWYVHHFPP